MQQADQTNKVLRDQLKEQIELTLCANKQAEIKLARRKQASTILLKSEIYNHIQKQLHTTKISKNLLSNNISPIDIAKLTMHSKEAITSNRRRLYEKVFGKKGTPKDWDSFILSL